MQSTSNETPAPLAYSIPEFMALTSIRSRTTIANEIQSGRLKTVQVGSRRLITQEAAVAWLDALTSEGKS